MSNKHKAAINILKENLEKDEKVLALIITGSTASGTAKEDSDIDIYVVVTEDEFNKKMSKQDIFYYSDEVIKNTDCYVDGKIVSVNYLKEAVDNANEPTRFSFKDTKIIFSKIDGLESILDDISKYPEHEREKKITAFHSQLQTSHYHACYAIEKNNTYLAQRSVNDLILFGFRLLLAYNRILYPCHKGLFKTIKKAEELPDNIIQTAYDLMDNITKENIDKFNNLILNFKDWNISEKEDINQTLQNEITWYTKKISFDVW